ncbi:hypothetical protein [Celeribacter neptunius]|uniref:Uncharacterized protein n=1 Tax=Celeribacter neptunius TaxID=588602 RepID=A0A1I3QKE3_9RHOB|nr:hypothetical protein [Celeribacter neptunius]SFJ34022.1 hypothetical protein SAMN04487991_1855 [Celeribacter neptunius]
MILLIPLILIALYLGMYFMRTERTSDCRWRQTGREQDERLWRCQVCGAEARTEKGEPKHCGATAPKL